MKSTFFSLVVLFAFSLSAMAAPAVGKNRKPAADDVKCSNNPDVWLDPDFVIQQIKAASTCYDASHIAESCQAGSSMDNMVAGAAVDACDKFTGKLSSSDAHLKKLMQERCEKTCNPRNDGTLCQSELAFCGLSVSKFLNSVNSK